MNVTTQENAMANAARKVNPYDDALTKEIIKNANDAAQEAMEAKISTALRHLAIILDLPVELLLAEPLTTSVKAPTLEEVAAEVHADGEAATVDEDYDCNAKRPTVWHARVIGYNHTSDHNVTIEGRIDFEAAAEHVREHSSVLHPDWFVREVLGAALAVDFGE